MTISTSTPTRTLTGSLAGGASDGLAPTLTAAGTGPHLHFLNHLATTKVSHERTASGLNAVEFTAPRGFGPPLHLHHEEDEIMYVLDGILRLEIGGERAEATPGAVVALPAGVPHTFQVTSETATFLTVAGGSRSAPTFDTFVSALGEPTEQATQPEPVDIDPGHVASVAASHGIEILGPPPAPLD
jgi:quercetin dioxygenase-like cupin family protein